MSDNIYTFPMVGWSRYQYNGREGFYLNCIEEYPTDDKNVGGAFQTAISAPYEESSKMQGVPMSLASPATIKFSGRLQSRGSSSSLVCTEIISITPSPRVHQPSSAPQSEKPKP